MNGNNVLAKKPFDAYSGVEDYVFISYKHDDSAIVYRDIAELHDRGYHIWYDQGIQIDENWGKYVAKYLLGASKVLFFISQKSVNSPYVLNEIRIAIENHIPITYIHIDGTPIPNEFLISDPTAAGKQRIVRQKQQWEDYIAEICSAIPNSCQDAAVRSRIEEENRRRENERQQKMIDEAAKKHREDELRAERRRKLQQYLETAKKVGKYAAIAVVVVLVIALGNSLIQKLASGEPVTEFSIPENVEVAPESDFEWRVLENKYAEITKYVGDDIYINIPRTLNGLQVTSIDEWFISGYYGTDTTVQYVIIPEGVTTIKENAFYCCEALNAIDFPDTLETIGRAAFWGCNNLTEVSIPDSVVFMDWGAFCYCENLVSVSLGRNIETLAGFNGCEKLTSIVIPESVKIIGDGAFRDCKMLQNVVIPQGVTSIGEEAFLGCNSITSISIPDSVTYIDGMAFKDCINLESITLGSGITELGSGWGNQFKGCSSLKSITIPGNVKSVGSVFEECTSLEELRLEYGVEELGSWSLGQCTSLSRIYIPASVTEIYGGGYFENAGRITVYGKSGTAAEQFAAENGMLFVEE